MPKYRVIDYWSGPSRGHTTYEVEAETPADAENAIFEEELEGTRVVVRDDTETHLVEVEEITDA
ncbi:MAG: hypothetical protein AAF628_08440 [Planctomycetota bacterium]